MSAVTSTWWVLAGASAVRSRAPCSAFPKIDIFCAKDDALSRAELDRRLMIDVRGQQIPVCTPEDIILQKLLWYVEAGGSERQWNDALGVVKTRGESLDRAYLEAHALGAGVSDLLARLLTSG